MKVKIELPIFSDLLPTEQTEVLRRIEANIKAIAQEMNQPCQVTGWMSDRCLDWRFNQPEGE